MSFDIQSIRKLFPALQQDVHPNKPLVYLDSGATALKPQAVIDAVVRAYALNCANIHRAVHALSQRATAEFEDGREVVRRFIGAPSRKEIIFSAGTTASINLVANSFCEAFIEEGDEIIVTAMDHHSNIVPWQLAEKRHGVKVRFLPFDENGNINLNTFRELFGPRTKLATFPHVSNSLGSRLPIEEMISIAKTFGARTLIDGAQGIVHEKVDVQALDCDFYAFSGHKLFGPTGIGVLYGKETLLDEMPPFFGGGDMIDRVTLDGSTWNDLPHKFEAGTPNIAGVFGLKAAIEWLETLDLDSAFAHEEKVVAYALNALNAIDGVRLIGHPDRRSGVISFVVDGAHPSDIGSLLDARGVAIRTGHHCAEPVMNFFGVPGTARASFSIYNSESDVDTFIEALKKAMTMLGVG